MASLLYFLTMVPAAVMVLFYFSLLFHFNPSGISMSFYIQTIPVFILCAAASWYLGLRMFRRDRKGFLLLHAVSFSVVVIILIVGEIRARSFLPPWPARDLHGVQPAIGGREWGRVRDLHPNAVGSNSWGQRDRERTLSPDPGKIRISFVGDSFLEESSIIPVSLLTELELGDPFEVINLGISVSSPVDYYWRTRRVALRTGSHHIFVFIYMGNDVTPREDLNALTILKRGLSGPLPRERLLGDLFPGLHHVMARRYNHSRNVWVLGNLHQREQERLEHIRKAGSAGLPEQLIGYYTGSDYASCLETLWKKDLGAFYEDLTHPDMGLIRTSAFHKAVCPAGGEAVPVMDREQVRSSKMYTMLSLIKRRCDEAGAAFTAVIIPQGFDVDDRMREQWLPLADLRRQVSRLPAQAVLIRQLLEEDSIACLDLYPVFRNTRGSYLNFDGHWSAMGNGLAAGSLAEYIREWYRVH